jgi:hypothetical protein
LFIKEFKHFNRKQSKKSSKHTFQRDQKISNKIQNRKHLRLGLFKKQGQLENTILALFGIHPRHNLEK